MDRRTTPSERAAGRGFGRWGWLAVAAAAVLLLAVLGWVYRPFIVSGLDIVAEATGSRTTALLAVFLTFLGLVWLAVWMLLPVMLYLSLRDLRRRAARIERALEHLAQGCGALNSGEPPPRAGQAPTENPTGASVPPSEPPRQA